ncbi:hemerythrin domain-containing protein [Alcanivorax sp. IL1]|uniref:hemerythrin domain-containing protein n=1 Tax=Alcanivorax sp. IL1 TaxID=3396308 RepID=UPI0039C38C17
MASTSDHHVLSRQGLPEEVRSRLITLPRDEWREHENYLISNARPLQRNHNSLKRQARHYHASLEQVLNQRESASAYTDGMIEVERVGKSLLRNLHSHHGYEDSSVFPVLRRDHPRLTVGFDLLEQDHGVLEASLEELDSNLRRFAQKNRQPR